MRKRQCTTFVFKTEYFNQPLHGTTKTTHKTKKHHTKLRTHQKTSKNLLSNGSCFMLFPLRNGSACLKVVPMQLWAQICTFDMWR